VVIRNEPMNESPKSVFLGAGPEVPPWRHKKYAGRPVEVYDFETGEFKEREPKLPERLYRQVPIEDLYFIWRDNEMPLQLFEGSSQSMVEKNSLGNFWFTQPVSLDSIEGYIVTEPARWKQDPEYVQESNMRFKSDRKRSEMGEWGVWRPNDLTYRIEEIHTGNRLKIDELTICVSKSAHRKIELEAAALRNWDMTDDELADAYLRGDLGIEPYPWVKDRQGAIFVLRNGVRERLAKIFKREFGNMLRLEGDKRSDNDISQEYGQKKMADPQMVEKLKSFYDWALKLPVLPEGARPADIEDVVEDPKRSKENERRFLEFYDKIRPKES